MSIYTHRKSFLSTVIHIFSTSGGKGVISDNPQEVIQMERLRVWAELLG
jgi:hypothetical protein